MQNLNTIYRGIFEKIEHLSVCGPSPKALCVAMATLIAILLQPIDGALLSLFQGEI